MDPWLAFVEISTSIREAAEHLHCMFPEPSLEPATLHSPSRRAGCSSPRAALDQINNIDLCHIGEFLHHRFPEVPQGRSFVRSALAYSKSAAQLLGPV
jgi:hypothetical protein